MARYLAIMLSTLLGLNVVLGVTGGPAGGITICLGHDDARHAPPAAPHAQHAHPDCDDQPVHLHLADHTDCCCADLPLTITEAPDYARTDSKFPAPHAAEAFPLALPSLAGTPQQWRPPLLHPGDDPRAQTPRRHVRTTQLRL